MKKLIYTLAIILIVLSLFTSCEKDEYEPWVYVPELQDTTKWQDDYSDGGTLQNGTGSDNAINGTKWVLTKMVTSFATEYPNDTLEFISNTNYKINGTLVRNYQLSSIVGSTNYDLSLYYMTTFGGSHYSANVGFYFVDDGVIDNVEFHNIQNTTSKIRAWFKKI